MRAIEIASIFEMDLGCEKNIGTIFIGEKITTFSYFVSSLKIGSILNKYFNPWNHRADISAQAYLKPSKKGIKNVTELFLPNTL